MKRNIFMYLFLFAALWIIFQFVNVQKVSQGFEKRIEKAERNYEKAAHALGIAEDSINVLEERIFDVEYFTLIGNDKGSSYFQDDGYDLDSLAQKIEDGVYAKNTTTGNTLIPYEENPYRVNKVHLLNHRWLIADFSDNKDWGEILVKYFINENGSIDYETIESLIYPRN